MLSLGDDANRRTLRHDRLNELIAASSCPAVLRGAGAGLLFGDGAMTPEDLVIRFQGHLHHTGEAGHAGAAYLRGLLRTARSVLWLVPEVLDCLHRTLCDWEEDRFVDALPELRLAFADLTPRECDLVARRVAGIAGDEEASQSLAKGALEGFNEQDLMRAIAVNRQVLDLLKQDGLEDDGER